MTPLEAGNAVEANGVSTPGLLVSAPVRDDIYSTHANAPALDDVKPMQYRHL
jgi:hypothetical protein